MIDILVLPPSGPLFLGLLGLLLLRWRQRLGIALMATGLTLAYALSIPLTAAALNQRLQHYQPVSEEALRQGRPGAIVVLAGGLSADAPEYGADTINLRTLGRVRYAAYLARRTGLPVLASGGINDDEDDPTEAQLMRRVLEEEYGIGGVLAETASRTTRENALRSAEMLRARNIDAVVLVTHAAHMARAVESFRRAGVEVIPAPTLFFGATLTPEDPGSWLPSARAVYEVSYALHEWLGQAWYWWLDG